MIRLNKYITDAGYCSRREADTYISQGRVTVNGVDAVIGTSVKEGDMVEVDGEKIGKKPKIMSIWRLISLSALPVPPIKLIKQILSTI